MYSLVDLFAGCGGLSLGFEQAGFQPVFVNELNDDARATYLCNRTHQLGGLQFADCKELHSKDANELSQEKLDEIIQHFRNIPEINYTSEKFANRRSGGGSNIDVVAGGPPCQGFSGIGHRRNWGVDRKQIPANFLFKRMCFIISNFRPRIFLFENVRGILNAHWEGNRTSRVWETILSEFKAIEGYEVRWSLIKSKDYGTPQNRPRVLLVGIRKDIVSNNNKLDLTLDPEDAVKCGFLPNGKLQTYPDLIDLLGDLIDPDIEKMLMTGEYPKGILETVKYPKKQKLTAVQTLLRQAPKGHGVKGIQLTDHVYSKHKKHIVQKFNIMQTGAKHLPEHLQTKKFSQRVLPERWNAAGPSITATSLPDDYIHFKQPRILTVREWARLQFFPDWYKFMGKRTTGGVRRAGNPQQGIFDREVPKYTQIGNAVPVNLAKSVARHFQEILQEAGR